MKPLFYSLALLLAGCAAPMKNVKVDSEPQGARVYFTTAINEASAAGTKNYIGTTPFTWMTRSEFEWPGAMVYSSFVPPVAVFTAELDGETRRHVFHGGTIATPAAKVPDGLFF